MQEQQTLPFAERPDITFPDMLRALDRGLRLLDKRISDWAEPRIAHLRANNQPVNRLTVLPAPSSGGSA